MVLLKLNHTTVKTRLWKDYVDTACQGRRIRLEQNAEHNVMFTLPIEIRPARAI
jgi:hypothetical protein